MGSLRGPSCEGPSEKAPLHEPFVTTLSAVAVHGRPDLHLTADCASRTRFRRVLRGGEHALATADLMLVVWQCAGFHRPVAGPLGVALAAPV